MGKLWVISISLLLAGTATFFVLTVVLDDLSPTEQAKALHEVSPHMPRKRAQLDKWLLDGSRLTATYEVEGSTLNGFELSVFENEDAAEEHYSALLEEISSHDRVQESNASRGNEYCVEWSPGTRCIGWESLRVFESATDGSDSNRQIDAVVLLHIARKHWARVFRD